MNDRIFYYILYYYIFILFHHIYSGSMPFKHSLFVFSHITFISQVPIYLFDPLSHTASTHCSYHPINQFNQHGFIMVVKKRQTQLFQQSQTLQHNHRHTTNTIHTARQSHTTHSNRTRIHS